MLTLFRAVVDRLKVLFATAAAAELEAEFLAREAERRADLFRQADRYAADGLPVVAAGLRARAEALSADRPGGTVLPAMAHWLAADPAGPGPAAG
ncbi:MAG: hypothetical protein JWO38_8132, partial [Gemmataceae bacterium]|nr:hypothetical protein [Gemmataceae bacterium]